MQRGIDWRAVGIGVAASVAVSLLATLAFMAFPVRDPERWLPVIAATGFALGLLADVAAGAAAGWFAARRGALHGALAAAIAGVATHLLQLLQAWWVEIDLRDAFLQAGFLVGAVVAFLIGLVVAAIAGSLAARFAARS